MTVGHVAHVGAALRIVQDGRLRSDLVFDESRLNRDRIRVVWLSPNDWSNAGGFRYGNVRFQFDWEPLTNNKRAYWVESIAYGVEACRILITNMNYGDLLQSYDPRRERGPWWVSPQGTHYWNADHCLEIIYEGDLPLDQASGFDFVRHHPRYCNIDYRACADKDRADLDAAAEFLGTLASENRRVYLPGLVEDVGGTPRPSVPLRQAHSLLYRRCEMLTIEGGGRLRAADPHAAPIARALLRSLAQRELRQDAAALASQFRSSKEAGRAITEMLAQAAGLPSGELFFQFDF